MCAFMYSTPAEVLNTLLMMKAIGFLLAAKRTIHMMIGV